MEKSRSWPIKPEELQEFLDFKSEFYETPNFIESDPIQIPRLFTRKEDVEIAGFLTATISWGQRKTIIRNALSLMEGMDMAPYDFVRNFTENDLDIFDGFQHRTFSSEDLKTFLLALQNVYSNHGGLEAAFSNNGTDMSQGISEFKKTFFEISHSARTQKHVSDPMKGSAAKRLNMFLRWMVRSPKKGVDFGIWKSILPSQLYLPLDVHTANVSRQLALLTRKQNDWKALEEVMNRLRILDSEDPVKYDFALFGLGVFEGFGK
jgi:uncharacterized protein (TIGR02757 family)